MLSPALSKRAFNSLVNNMLASLALASANCAARRATGARGIGDHGGRGYQAQRNLQGWDSPQRLRRGSGSKEAVPGKGPHKSSTAGASLSASVAAGAGAAAWRAAMPGEPGPWAQAKVCQPAAASVSHHRGRSGACSPRTAAPSPWLALPARRAAMDGSPWAAELYQLPFAGAVQHTRLAGCVQRQVA